ncbi:PKD domain-containing protein [Streptomonospora salina]|uniref:PKD domain-containing protein n=1 Tax=Streptomonospora salina TaxID=104205 RepID=A0A841ECH5_9ACTN|nr:PKD domain-containing protein [Streptomonospora salina]MBB5998763.1 hypothetical protein [Streptomonospora salina]
MLTVRSVLATSATATLVLALASSPASAEVVCSQITGECRILADDPGESGDSPNSEQAADESGTTEVVSECERETAGAPAEDCLFTDGLPSTGGDQPSPDEVARQAIEELDLPLPQVGLAPPTGTGLVGAPVWMWVEDDGWSPVSRTATAGSVSVTATATPTSVTWHMGDGASVACSGPGTPYTRDADASASPDCGHSYSAPGEYEITATVHWSIEWQGGGASGTDSLTRTSSDTLRIGEGQALVQ